MDSVVENAMKSGPAAAARPLFGAMLRSDDVAGGCSSHGFVRRTLASPATERKPRAYYMNC